MESEQLCDICKKNIGYPEEINGIYGVLCDDMECIKKANNRVAERIAKQKLEHAEENIIKAEIPLKFREINSDREYKHLAIREGVYLYGTAGTGKTVMACSVLRQHIYNGQTGLFRSAPGMVMELQESYKKEGESALSILKGLVKCDVLVIDDLGAEKMTDFVRQSFYYLINEREQWMKTTIITSNYSLSELNDQIDGRISSRIAGMCKVVKLTGNDRRVK